MGIYYKWVNDTKREAVEPANIKRPCSGHVLKYMANLVGSRWQGDTVRLISDSGEDDEAYDYYAEIAEIPPGDFRDDIAEPRYVEQIIKPSLFEPRVWTPEMFRDLYEALRQQFNPESVTFMTVEKGDSK